MTKYCLGLSTNPGRKIPQISEIHSSWSLASTDDERGQAYFSEFKYKWKKKKRYGTNSLSQGSHLAPLGEMNPKHPPHRCQPKDSRSKTQHSAFPPSSEAVLPFQCRCSTKVIIPQLTDLMPRHRHQLVRFPGGSHNLLNTPSYNIGLFLPGTQRDFTGTVQSEYFLTGFLRSYASCHPLYKTAIE